MSYSLLAIWHSSALAGGVTIVLPDGCRDLIIQVTDKQKPECYVSPLFDTAGAVRVEQGTGLTGFRLKAGAVIDEAALTTFAASCPFDRQRLEEALDDFVTISQPVDESLTRLSGDIGSVKLAAKHLGVSERTLQRTLLNATGRSPGYWLQLARARRAARGLSQHGSFAALASHHGFSDQSHMNREFRRWFGVAPGELSKVRDLLAQLDSPAYG